MDHEIALHVRFHEQLSPVPFLDVVASFGREATVDAFVEELRRGLGAAGGDRALVLEQARSGEVLAGPRPLASCRLLRGDVLILRPTASGDVLAMDDGVGARAWLREERGRDAGRLIPLYEGVTRLGGARDRVDVVIDDPQATDVVVEVRVDGGGGLTLVPATGTVTVDGEPAERNRALELGQGITFGRYALLRVVGADEGELPNPFGQVPFLPSLDDELAPVLIRSVRGASRTPPHGAGARFPWESVAAGGLMAVFFVVILGRPVFAFLGAIPLIVSGISYLRQRQRIADEQVAADRASEEERRRIAASLVRAAEDEGAIRARNHLPVRDDVFLRAFRRQADTWTRPVASPAFLVLRVGTTSVPAAARVDSSDLDAPDVTTPAVDDVPALLDLRKLDIGVLGSGPALFEFVSELTLQAAVLHPPRDLRIILAVPGLGSQAEAMQGLAWLPHLQVSGRPVRFCRDVEQVNARLVAATQELEHLQQSGMEDRLPHTLLVLHEAVQPDAELMDRAFAERPDHLHLLWFGAHRAAAPPQLGALVEANGTKLTSVRGPVEWRAATWSAPDLAEQQVRRELGADDSTVIARALAPLHDRRDLVQGASLPSIVHLLPLLGEAEAQDPRRTTEDSLLVAMGVHEHGPLVLDLVRYGPHVLIGGTTGAGKGELLQTIVASAVHRYQPEEVNLFLFDFKGNATFVGCETLGHTMGTVSNLDAAEIDRSLRFLEAELQNRMRRFDDASEGRDDKIRSYEHFRDTCPDEVMPRLLVIFDEFAALVGHFDAARTTAQRLAQQGRSLGMHVIIATQNPTTGVIGRDVQANVGARLALRTVSDHESQIIIGTRDAALVPKETPGRGILQPDPTKLIGFQGGFAGGSVEDGDRTGVRLTRFASATSSGRAASDRPRRRTTGPTSFEEVLRARSGTPGAPVASHFHPAFDGAPRRAVAPIALVNIATGGLVLGECDDIERQTRSPFSVSLERGALLVAGGMATGKSSVLGLIAQQVRAHDPRAQVIGVDSSSEDLLDVHGASFDWVFQSTERSQLELLLHQLSAELRRRRSADLATLVPAYALIDDLQPLYEQLTLRSDGLELVRRLADVIRRGRRHRIFVAATAHSLEFGSAALRGVFAHRLQLRPGPDEHETMPTAQHLPPGVALDGGGRQVKLFAPHETMATTPAGSLDLWFGELPVSLDAGDLGDERALGLAEVERRSVPLTVEPGRHVLVAASAAEDRAIGLAHVTRVLAGATCRLVTFPPEPGDDMMSEWLRDPTRHDMTRDGPLVVVVPEAHRLDGHDRAVIMNVKGLDNVGFLVVSFDPLQLLAAADDGQTFRRFVQRWAVSQRVLYLGAPRPSLEALGNAIGGPPIMGRVDIDEIAGRGIWYDRGIQTVLQVPER